MAKKYTVEAGRSEGGARGFVVLNPKGKEVYFDTSKAECETVCETHNAKLAPKSSKQPKSGFTKTARLPRAVDAARDFIQKLVKRDGTVEIHTYKDAQGGIRVAEVSVFKSNGNGGGGGYSWMRADVGSGAGEILIAVEDFIITYDIKPYKPDGWESDIDEHADAQYKLECAITERK